MRARAMVPLLEAGAHLKVSNMSNLNELPPNVP
jgi:hypothetical protein